MRPIWLLHAKVRLFSIFSHTYTRISGAQLELYLFTVFQRNFCAYFRFFSVFESSSRFEWLCARVGSFCSGFSLNLVRVFWTLRLEYNLLRENSSISRIIQLNFRDMGCLRRGFYLNLFNVCVSGRLGVNWVNLPPSWIDLCGIIMQWNELWICTR